LINPAIRSFMMWKHNHWLPQLAFSKQIFSELFSFGSNILIISVIAVIYKSIYNFIIGKNYSDTVLGYYTNSDQYSSIPSTTLTNITSKVSFPVLSQVQDENERLKASISKLIKTVMYVSFIIMFGLAAIAHPLFSVLFGDKWLPSVPIFQFLCLAYAIAPMHAINHNILKVKGRSDLFLKTEILKYILFTPILIAGIIYGLKILVAGIVLFYWMGFFINALYSKKLINYSIVSQCRDFFPLIIILGVPAFVVLAIGLVLPVSTFLLLLIQITVYTLLTVGVSVLLKVAGFLGIVEILRNKFTVNNIVKTLKNTE
jgi:teichuronic acid exporter